MCSEIQPPRDSGFGLYLWKDLRRAFGVCFSEVIEFQTRQESEERDFSVQVFETCGVCITVLAKFPFEASADFNRGMQIFYLCQKTPVAAELGSQDAFLEYWY